MACDCFKIPAKYSPLRKRKKSFLSSTYENHRLFCTRSNACYKRTILSSLSWPISFFGLASMNYDIKLY